jgi:tRNA dimethylallyltransferase
VLVLRREPADLRARIECRVERMFADGLVEETRRLLDAGLRQNRTASQAIGYRQVVDHLDGRLSLEAVREQVRWKTWQYARRQMSWFRTQWESVWVDTGAQESAATIAERIAVSLHRT